jgi:hypothetical protein
MAQEDFNIRFKASLDAGNAVFGAKAAAAAFNEMAKAGGEAALAEKHVSEWRHKASGPAPDISRAAREAAVGRIQNAPDTSRAVQEAIHNVEKIISSISEAKLQAKKSGDPESALKYEQLYSYINQNYSGEMSEEKKESADFTKIKRDAEEAGQERGNTEDNASEAFEKWERKKQERDGSLIALRAARKETERADEDPKSEYLETAVKIAQSAKETLIQAEQAAKKAANDAADAEEKYTAAKEKAAKAARNAADKHAALEKAAETRQSAAAERALRLNNIAADAWDEKQAIGVKAWKEEGGAQKDLLARTMRGISKIINRGSAYIGQAGGGRRRRHAGIIG